MSAWIFTEAREPERGFDFYSRELPGTEYSFFLTTTNTTLQDLMDGLLPEDQLI